MRGTRFIGWHGVGLLSEMYLYGFIGMQDSDIAMHDDTVTDTVILEITDDGPFHL